MKLKLKKNIKVMIIALFALALVGVIAARVSTLKATDDADAQYAGEEQTEGTEGQDSTEIITIPAQPSVSIAASYEGGEFTGLGSVIYLTAIPSGYEEGAVLTYQWQVDAGNGPVDIPGANGSTFTVVIDENNYTYSWSVVVSD